MFTKEKDLVNCYLQGRMSRRDFMRGMLALGATASLTGTLLAGASTRAMAADFDWKKFSGKKIKLLLNKHPYADAMLANLDSFKALTGMEVEYDIFPEDVYFDKVTAALSSKSTEYDAFMTGAYMTWTYGPAGWVTDLNEYINDPAKTNPNYNWDDVLPGLRASTAWDGIPGSQLGSKDAKQWCIPWGYELNNLSYNRVMFEKAGLSAPKNIDELLETAAKAQQDLGGPYGVGVRGSRSWATIHPGFLSGYANFGQKDLTMKDDGTLEAAMNTQVSKRLSCQMGENDSGFRAEKLVDLHLVSSRH
ncbi:MAG: substrate-binding domain-containing protein [Thiolinea sp.]